MDFRFWLENKDVTETDEFKKWYAGSILVDKSGNPIPVYHGTQAVPFDKFSLDRTPTGRIQNYYRGVISFTFSFDYAATRYGGVRKDPDETKKTLGYFPHGRIVEAYLRVANPFDFRTPEHIKLLVDDARLATEKWAREKALFLKPGEDSSKRHGTTEENKEEKIKAYVDEEVAKTEKFASQGHYSQLEDPKFLKRHGFDGVYTIEFDQLHIHVLDPDQIWIVKQKYNRDMVA